MFQLDNNVGISGIPRRQLQINVMYLVHNHQMKTDGLSELYFYSSLGAGQIGIRHRLKT